MPKISKQNETRAEDLVNGIIGLVDGIDRHFEEMHNQLTQMKSDYKNDIIELEARMEAYGDKLIEELKAHNDNLIEELEAHDKKLISESEERIKASILQMGARLEAFDQSREYHQHIITPVKSYEKNNDIANQHTNVKIWCQNNTTPQTIPQLEDKKENDVVDLKSKQEAALIKIQSLIGEENENASTGITNMNNFLKDNHNYSNGKKPTFAELLNGLKACAQARTSWSFFSLPSFSDVSSFFSSFMSLGRKTWVNNLYTALNSMKDPNNTEDIKKLLDNLKEIRPDNTANKKYTSSQNVSFSKNI